MKAEDIPKPKIKCTVCTSAFKTDGDLYAHLYNCHVPTTLIKFGCSSCGYSMLEQKEWKLHKRWHIRDKHPYKCSRCQKHFPRYIEYSKHFLPHTCRPRPEVTQPDIPCQLCKRKYLTRNLYEWHNCFIKNKSTCRKCGKYFLKKQRLFEHFLQCPLPFMDVPKPEPMDYELPPLPAPPPKQAKKQPAKAAKAKVTNSLPKVRKELSAVHTTAQVTESELIIKSEHGELENDIAALLETNIHETADQPGGIEAISSLLDSVNAAIEKISSVSSKKKKKKKEKTREPRENADSEKRIEPLRLRLKTEFLGNSAENSQSANHDEDIALVPEYEHFVDIGSDDDDAAAVANSSEPAHRSASAFPLPLTTQIKQERLNAGYEEQLLGLRIKKERLEAVPTPTPAPTLRVKLERLELPSSAKVVVQPNAKVAAMVQRIKKEKIDKKSKKIAKGLAKQIKREKGVDGGSKVGLNPLAAAQKKKMLRIPAALALKIKTERVGGGNKKKRTQNAVRVKRERPDSDGDEPPPSYLGLNPLSIAKSVCAADDASSSFPTVQIPSSNLQSMQLPIITSVVSQAADFDGAPEIRGGSVTPDLDEFLHLGETSPKKKASPAKQTRSGRQNGFTDPGARSNLVISNVTSVSSTDFSREAPSSGGDLFDDLDSILDSNHTDYENAMTAAFEADDLLKQIDEQLRRSTATTDPFKNP